MRKIFVLVLFVGGFITSSVFGQTTAVTATITDSDSQTWNNGTWTATLYNAQVPNGPFYLDGVKLTSSQIQSKGSMNSSGVITATLYDVVNHIGPGGTYYQFQLCPQASAPCQVIGASPTGTSINLSATLSANLAGPRFPATGSNAFGYLDGEVSPTPLPGGQYFNVSNTINRIWNGSSWINGTGGGGSPSVGSRYAAQIAGVTSGTFADSGAKLAVDAGGNYELASSFSNFPLNANNTNNIMLGGGCPLLGSASTTTAQGDVICLGHMAGNSLLYGEGSIYIGNYSGQMHVGANIGGEDGNTVCIGTFSCQVDTTGAENVVAGLKSYTYGNGEQSSVILGSHNYFRTGGTGNVDVGSTIAFWSNTNSDNTTFFGGVGGVNLGYGIYAGPNNLTPNTTYTTNRQTVVGAYAGGCLFNTSDNLLLGSLTADPVGGNGHGAITCPGTLPTATENILAQPGNNSGTNPNVGGAITTASQNIILSLISNNPAGVGGSALTTGSRNVIAGAGAGSKLTTGSENLLLGDDAGYALTTASSQVAVGPFALDALTTGTTATGDGDVSIGDQACNLLTTAEFSDVCIGASAEVSVGSNQSVAVGANSKAATQGVAVGYGAVDSTANSGNTLIGDITTAATGTQYDTLLGIAAAASTNVQNSIAIGRGATAGASSSIELDDTGAVDTNSTAHTLQYDLLPIASSATFSVAGCGTAGSITGSGLAGTFTAGATSCTPVITTGVTAPHGYVCDIHDRNAVTPTSAFEVSSNATTATFPTLTVTSADVMAFRCKAY